MRKGKPKPPLTWTCEKCGLVLPPGDFRFWGECPRCNMGTPHGHRKVQSVAELHDMRYHGGKFHSGEW